MDKKSIEWHRYKRDIYKKARMWAAMTCEELAIEGIEARLRLKLKAPIKRLNN